MINFKTIMQGVENLFNANLSDKYLIERNPIRPEDPFKASEKDGWIGIYRGRLDYEPHTIRRWLSAVEITIEIQVVSTKSPEDAEDKLCDAENDIMILLDANPSLNQTVDTTTGYSIEYEINETESTYYQAAIITIKAEVRA